MPTLPKPVIVAGQPSWRMKSRSVDLALTVRGGHVAPVTFRCNGRSLQPLEVAPWAEEKLDRSIPPILQVLRGDFFCLPFGGNETPFKNERHPVHGETANARWQLKSLTRSGRMLHLHARLRTNVRSGTVDKHLTLIDNHPAIYSRHVLSGMRGPMNYGHHAIVAFPPEPGSGVISISPFALGQVFPGMFEDPAKGGYSSFSPGATFRSLRAVPTIFGPTDASRYPARAGYEDLLMVQARPKKQLGWTAVTFAKERYVFFTLKDVRHLPGTVMWFSNGGRHMPPWSSRHRNAAGLEDVCSYFHSGLAESAGDNPHTQRGFKTSAMLDPDVPLQINYILAATTVGKGFDRVASIRATERGICLTAESGATQDVAVDSNFIWTGEPATASRVVV